MQRFPIPLNALHAIEIVARTGALKPAAAELGVTVGAVSQHIRRAEARLGVALFERTAQGLRPTPLLDEVRPLLSGGFDTLADAVRALGRPGDSVLTLTLGSVFASRWLIRRLPHFTARHPEVELRLVATGRLIDLAHSDIDCAIRYGEGKWPEMRAEPLGCRAFSPVAAPQLAAKLKRPPDLSKVPVIEDTSTMLSWAKWFEAAGSKPVPFAGPRYSDPALAFDAAIAGQGVLLGVDRMSEGAVREGQLVHPFAASVESPYDYWFVTSTARRVPAKVQQFRLWLMEELAG
ncbi:MAG TPA: LysR substrate-binding domain-containing protein [Devosia sp.]|jgi:DNA-binding transcriptional LysR family regulator|nr:LysR substrate-binding domain-containing protein [Devosia sp.]